MKAEGKGKPCFTFPRRISCCFIGTLSQTLTLRAAFASSTYLLPQIPEPGPASDDALLNPPDPLSKGAIRAYGLSIAAMPSLPASSGPASDDALLNPPDPLFKGAIRACGLSIAAMAFPARQLRPGI